VNRLFLAKKWLCKVGAGEATAEAKLQYRKLETAKISSSDKNEFLLGINPTLNNLGDAQ
jgi:hypothetical protein